MSGPQPPALQARLSVRAGDFSLEAELSLSEGVLVLFGPSGAGKSLTLQALAGLVQPAAGRVEVGGTVLFDAAGGVEVPTHQRRLGYVPQHHALLPFRTVAQNVAFGLPGPQRRAAPASVAPLLEELGLSHLAHADPQRLSGGERQRVALARALAVRPRLLLLDEPFASIDREGRRALGALLRTTLARHHTSAVLVTHDVEEAQALGDVVVRYARGRTVAAGPAREVLDAAGTLTLDAQVTGPPREVGAGEVELTLQQGRLRGPAHLLHPDAQGQLSLSLPLPADDEP